MAEHPIIANDVSSRLDMQPEKIPNVLRSSVFAFHGRMARLRFICWLLGGTIVGSILAAVLMATTNDPNLQIGLVAVLALPFAWLALALLVKRLHDLDRSAKHLAWILTVVVLPALATSGASRIILPIGSTVVQLWLMFKRGSVGPNQFGPDPRARTGSQEITVGPNQPRITRSPSVARVVFLSVGALAVVGVAAVAALAQLGSSGLPPCSDPGVAERVARLTSNYAKGDVTAFVAGGIQNLSFSVRDVRTLSNDEPLNGRTCVANVIVTAKGPAARQGDLGARQVTYTIQEVDGQQGKYVVSLAD